MRHLVIIFLAALVTFSCVKRRSDRTTPELTYKGLENYGKSVYTNSDTAVLVMEYADGDGDLFVNNSTDDPNLVIISYNFLPDSNKFIVGDISGKTLKQPDNGYYKGKSIRGELYIPMKQFRLNDGIKMVKFEAFMVDMKKNKSNVIASPVYTLNF
jgi:hypothetical protein